MNKRSNIVFLYLISMFALLLSGCSSSSSSDSPPPQFYLKASNPEAADNFGKTVALSGDGDTLAIGAWGEDSDGSIEGDNSELGSGAVYIFRRDVDKKGFSQEIVSWNQIQYVKAPTPVASENFGFSVSLNQDGSKLAVGAPDISGTTPGKVYVYIGPNFDTSPTEITDPSATNGDRFGEAVALSDDGFRLAIGAPGDDTVPSDAGAVYVYEDLGNANSWTVEDSFTTAPAGAGLGVSVALNQDGSVLASGAWMEDDAAANEGAIYSFTRSGTTWTAVTKLVSSDGVLDDRLGTSVSLNDDGTRLAVGAPGDFFGGGGSTGAVYVYTADMTPVTSWTNEQKVTASNAEADDAFGIAVSLSSNGNMLLVGASYEDGSGTDTGSTPDNLASNAGAAYYFSWDTMAWNENEYIKATNTDAGDLFGVSVTMDDSGSRVVIGATGEGSNASGVNGDQTNDSESSAGAAYLWNL